MRAVIRVVRCLLALGGFDSRHWSTKPVVWRCEGDWHDPANWRKL